MFVDAFVYVFDVSNALGRSWGFSLGARWDVERVLKLTRFQKG